jgi:hypothetical protein
MEYLRIKPDIDTDPELEAAGWTAARVYELLLKVSAMKDLRGRLPPECLKPEWLAKRWNLTGDSWPGIDPMRFIVHGLEKLHDVGKLYTDASDGTTVIRGWENFYKPSKSTAERSREYRQRHGPSHSPVTHHEASRRHVTEEVPVTQSDAVTRHERHATPPTNTTHSTPPTTNQGVAVAADADFFVWSQEERLKVLPAALPESGAPPNFWEWWPRAVGEVGIARLQGAWRGYLHDDWARQLKPPCPMGAFVAKDRWKRTVPGQSNGASGTQGDRARLRGRAS